jgi:hypothetical protein
MSLSHHQQHQLHRIETGLLRSDPQLAAMLGIFVTLSAGEVMPDWEQMPPRQQSIRQAAALIVNAITVIADAIVLLFRAVLTLAIATGHPSQPPPAGTPARTHPPRPEADGRPGVAGQN